RCGARGSAGDRRPTGRAAQAKRGSTTGGAYRSCGLRANSILEKHFLDIPAFSPHPARALADQGARENQASAGGSAGEHGVMVASGKGKQQNGGRFGSRIEKIALPNYFDHKPLKSGESAKEKFGKSLEIQIFGQCHGVEIIDSGRINSCENLEIQIFAGGVPPGRRRPRRLAQ
ncbi:MAG: hypothetical protein ACLPNY_00335, partial [Roseiarcus sp.]